MNTYDNLKNSITGERTVEGRVSKLISGFTTLVEQNKGNPQALADFAKEANSNKSALVHTIVSGSGSGTGPEK